MRNAERRQLDGYLTGVRHELFGKSEPPFASLREAEAWIRSESDRGEAVSGNSERRDEFHTRLKLIEADVRALGQLAPSGIHISLGVGHDLVDFYSEHDGAVNRVLATTKELQRIAEVARDGANYGEVSEASIAMRLLVGAPFPVGRESKRSISNPVGFTERRSVRLDKDVRKWTEAFESPNLKPRDRELVRFIHSLEESGEHPPTAPGRRGQNAGVRRYWQSVLLQWNLAHDDPYWRYGHWTSVRRRYELVVSQLPERPQL